MLRAHRRRQRELRSRPSSARLNAWVKSPPVKNPGGSSTRPWQLRTRGHALWPSLREAQRLGLVNAGGEGNHPVATPEQERLITLAGVRALEEPAMASARLAGMRNEGCACLALAFGRVRQRADTIVQ